MQGSAEAIVKWSLLRSLACKFERGVYAEAWFHEESKIYNK